MKYRDMLVESKCIPLVFTAVIICGAISSSSATDYQFPSDHDHQEELMRHFTQFLPVNLADNVMHATQVRKYENYVEGVRSASDIYRQNLTLSDIIARLENSSLANSTCLNLILKTRRDLRLGLPYAAYMDDSNGREESGLHKGNFMWLGRYYECMGQTDGGDITAKMCLLISGQDPSGVIGMRSGECVPNVCEEEQLAEIFETLFLPRGQFATVRCPKEIPYDILDIVTITIFFFLALLVLVGTIWDIASSNSDASKSQQQAKIPASLGLLLSFSVVKNTKALFNTERKESSIPVLDGIRFFSITWVVLGHTCSILFGGVDNIIDCGTYYFNHIGTLAITNGSLSVDSFFFLSGFLVAYLALREMRAKGGKLNVPLMYLQRYLRLTPAVILIMLFTMTIFQRIGGGLLYERYNQGLNTTCREYWWTNLLYINNLYPGEYLDGCAVWLWYLANDMQFYLLSPIFIYILYRWPKTGLIVMGSCVVVSAAITGALTRHYEIPTDVYLLGLIFRFLQLVSFPAPYGPSFENVSSQAAVEPVYWDDVYSRPWCRIGVYLIGMATGYILYATNKKIKMKKIYVAQLWIITAAVELAIVYGWWGQIHTFQPRHPPTYNVMAFYEAVRRPLWGFGLMWLTIACTTGYGGPINAILSWRVFLPLGRLAFSTYLFHPFVLQYMVSSREVELHIRVDILIYYFLAALVLSMSGGYLLFLMIEGPVAGMQKIMFSKYRSKPSRVPVNTETELRKRVDEEDRDQSTVEVARKLGYENEIEIDDEHKGIEEEESTDQL